MSFGGESARRFGLAGGTLAEGAPADLSYLTRNGGNWLRWITGSPKPTTHLFLGRELQGFPVMVWVGGKLVMKDRKVLD